MSLHDMSSPPRQTYYFPPIHFTILKLKKLFDWKSWRKLIRLNNICSRFKISIWEESLPTVIWNSPVIPSIKGTSPSLSTYGGPNKSKIGRSRSHAHFLPSSSRYKFRWNLLRTRSSIYQMFFRPIYGEIWLSCLVSCLFLDAVKYSIVRAST